jgi:hypothetical protein
VIRRSTEDWWRGWQPESGEGHFPVIGKPDCPWCYGTGRRSAYRYCCCVQAGGGSQQMRQPAKEPHRG